MARPDTPYGADHATDLSPPAAREEVHNRRISCNGFVREDGHYDIEAEITDNKTYSFPTSFRGDVSPDMFIHHMKVRVTINTDLEVLAAEAVTVAGPYAVCPTANDVFDSLVGLTIGPGWRRRVTAAIGGRHGCTHITELMGPVATVAIQTLFGEKARQKRAQGMSEEKSHDVSSLANSCIGHAVDQDDALALAHQKKRDAEALS